MSDHKRAALAGWVAGPALAAAAALAMWGFRQQAVEPRSLVGLCAAPAAPAICQARAALLYGQTNFLWGWAALAFGLAAFFHARSTALAVAAMVAGVWAVQNFNASWGMIGLALGLLTWLRAPAVA